MQKGFVSFEIILIVLTFALLATVAVPNAAALVDKAALAYEQKRLYSESQYVRTLNRTATVVSTGMSMDDFLTSKITVDKEIMLEIDRGTNTYRILRDEKTFGETHYLDKGVTFSDETDVPNRIWFDTKGSSRFAPSTNKSVTIVLKSRRDDKLKIVFDSVGRIRGDNKDE